ncbi:MAG: TrmB family transcriptional regulator [Candidatus Moranbacteria bacterium]|nr:TrmB family transcriptional regulator [Candidatus Moranbacteria bacterium]
MFYSETLSKSVLTPAQAEVYESLLTHGAQTAGSLARKTSLKRGLTYKVLDDLVGMGLAEKEEEEGKVAVFSPKHPSVLRDLVEFRRRALKDAELSLDAVLPSLISNFNIVSGAPGVEIYEGPEGIERVLNDSLSSKTVIYTYADSEAVEKYAKDINMRYVKKREKLGIPKKLLLFDSPTARKRMAALAPETSDTKLMAASGDHTLLRSAVEIYDGKIAYVTFSPDRMIGVIISDPFLYALQKYVFEYLWLIIPGKDGKEEHVEKKELSGNASETKKKPSRNTSGPPLMETAEYDDDEYFVRL